MNLKPASKIDFEEWNWGDGELYTDVPCEVLDCDVMDGLAKAVGVLISEVINEELAGGIDVKLGADGDLYIALPLTIKGDQALTFKVSLRDLVWEIPEEVNIAALSDELRALADLTHKGKPAP